MRKVAKRILGVATAVLMTAVMVAPAFAKTQASTSILPDDLTIAGLLKLILNILMYGLGAAAILGVIVVGIQYMTSRDNEAQATQAKKRLYEIVIGLVAWAVMFAVLNWLIPGGLNFNID